MLNQMKIKTEYAINHKTLNHMQQNCVLRALHQFLRSRGALLFTTRLFLQLINRRINYEINWVRDSFYGPERRLH